MMTPLLAQMGSCGMQGSRADNPIAHVISFVKRLFDIERAPQTDRQVAVYSFWRRITIEATVRNAIGLQAP
jgi:hypothetical protein